MVQNWELMKGSRANAAGRIAGRRGRVRIASAMCGALALMGGIAAGSTATWDSTGVATSSPKDGSGTWDLTSNHWNTGAVDTSWQSLNGAVAIFGTGTAAAGTIQLVSSVTAGGLTFNAPGSGNYTME
jgi:hypothetical protein